ncbi:MAG: CoA-binding protein [Chloroflexi bacterium]|nr:CoA-binding protein [Chloroflexota bacterium]
MPVTSDDDLRGIIERSRRIAVVGLSSNPARPSNGVALFLKARGFDIVPVNPNETVVLGAAAVADLGQIDGPVDLVNVFRRPEYCADIARVAVEIGAGALWLQQGIRNDEAMAIAEAGGLKAVQDRCLRVEVQRLLRRR